MGRLEARVAIVTGGGRGIGRAIAEAYSAEGARVFIVGRDPDRTRATAEAIRGSAGPVGWFVGDVGDETRVGEIVASVLGTAGRIDVMVNNAAVQVEARLLDQTVEDFRSIVDTNLLGTFLYSRAVLPSMLAQGSGVIVNLSSVLGLVGDAMLPVYSATKHGHPRAHEVDRDRLRGPGHPVRGDLPRRRRHGPQPALLREPGRPGRRFALASSASTRTAGSPGPPRSPGRPCSSPVTTPSASTARTSWWTAGS